MAELPRRFWQDMSSREFAALDKERVIAVLPVGAIEQHGPHLPVSTDACINQGVLTRAVEQMPDDLPVTVLPMLPIGKSNEHLAFAGTLTLSAFGPGAVGVGWDMGLLGLHMHLSSGAAVAGEAGAAWMASEEGREFMRRSSEDWGRASIAAGTDEELAKASASRTTAAYLGESIEGDGSDTTDG
jgi:hypothetical protein